MAKTGRPTKGDIVKYTRSGHRKVVEAFKMECYRNSTDMGDVLQNMMISYVQSSRSVRAEQPEDFTELN